MTCTICNERDAFQGFNQCSVCGMEALEQFCAELGSFDMSSRDNLIKLIDMSLDNSDKLGMKITIPARVLLDKGLWDQACGLIGLNVWTINEGRMDLSDEVSLTQEQAQELGLLVGEDI